MRSPAPFSLALARTLSALVVMASAAMGRHLLLEAQRLDRLNAHFVGPAGPDFSAFATSFRGYAMLTLTALFLWATIGVWRKQSSAALLLAMICLLYAVPAIGFELTVSNAPKESAPIPSGASISYAILLLACAIAGIKAAIDLKSEGAQPPSIRVGPPPLSRALREFEVIDDLPRDED